MLWQSEELGNIAPNNSFTIEGRYDLLGAKGRITNPPGGYQLQPAFLGCAARGTILAVFVAARFLPPRISGSYLLSWRTAMERVASSQEAAPLSLIPRV